MIDRRTYKQYNIAETVNEIFETSMQAWGHDETWRNMPRNHRNACLDSLNNMRFIAGCEPDLIPDPWSGVLLPIDVFFSYYGVPDRLSAVIQAAMQNSIGTIDTIDLTDNEEEAINDEEEAVIIDIVGTIGAPIDLTESDDDTFWEPEDMLTDPQSDSDDDVFDVWENPHNKN